MRNFEYEIQVPAELIEPVYSHVHHADSLRFLESARLKFLQSIGMPSESLVARGLFLVIASIEVEYKREIRFERLCVTCENPRIEDRSIRVHQRIINSRGKTAVEAEIESMMLSRELKRAIPPPTDFVRAFEALARLDN